MKNSKQLQKFIKKLVELSFKEEKLIESSVIKSMSILKSLPMENSIWALNEYLKQLKRKERKHIMYLETIIPMPPAQIQKVKKIVEKRVQINKVITSVRPEILGGFKLRVGDEVWDETLLSKINQIKEVISGRSYSSN